MSALSSFGGTLSRIGSGGGATTAPVYKGGIVIPSAEIGVQYSVDLSVYFSGTVIDTYSLDSGSLPDGFTLNPVLGILSGTTWASFNQPISIRALYNAGNTGGAISSIANLVVTFPAGKPAPVAVIMTDSETLPSFYFAGNNYFPLSGSPGYTGMSTYEGYAPYGVYLSGWTSSSFLDIKSMVWDFGEGSP
jgi:hypothetical protein